MFIYTRYVSQHGTGPKEEFYAKHLDLFSRLKLEYPVMLSLKEELGYFTSKRSTNYDEYVINVAAHTHTLEICKKENISNKGMEEFTKNWTYLYVLPTAMYLDSFPIGYKSKSEVWPRSNQPEKKLGLYCPW